MAKILLVEDDNNLREIYEARLQAEGYTIVSARDGEEALVVAKAEKPDLVISDVMMPKISGFEMLDILRNTEGLKDVKVVMLTALGQSEDQTRADSLGADRYLVKSQVTLEDIVNAAQQLLSGDGAAVAAPLSVAPAEPTEPAIPASTIPVVEPPTDATDDTGTAPALDEPATTNATTNGAVSEPVAVAVEPEPEPVVTPEETPVEPAVTVEATADEPVSVEQALNLESDTADTLDQEEAIIEKQVADFVDTAPATAPPEAPAAPTPDEPAPADVTPEAPVEETVTEPEPVVTPESTPVEPAVTAEAAAAPATPTPEQEQALADAVSSLSAPAGTEPLVAPSADPQAQPPTSEPKLTGSSNKHVIEPLGAAAPNPNKKSIEQLLAEEDAKSATPNAAPAADNKGDFDPNSIAL